MEFTQQSCPKCEQQVIDGVCLQCSELTGEEKLNSNNEEDEEEEEEDDDDIICACLAIFKATSLQYQPDVVCYACGKYICEECLDDSWHQVAYDVEEFFCAPCTLEIATMRVEKLKVKNEKLGC
jgi:hypothetical protein